jgi:hypothetical protein
MSTQGGIINGRSDFLETLILVELAKWLYTSIKPKICCVCVNNPNIPYQASDKFGRVFYSSSTKFSCVASYPNWFIRIRFLFYCSCYTFCPSKFLVSDTVNTLHVKIPIRKFLIVLFSLVYSNFQFIGRRYSLALNPHNMNIESDLYFLFLHVFQKSTNNTKHNPG